MNVREKENTHQLSPSGSGSEVRSEITPSEDWLNTPQKQKRTDSSDEENQTPLSDLYNNIGKSASTRVPEPPTPPIDPSAQEDNELKLHHRIVEDSLRDPKGAKTSSVMNIDQQQEELSLPAATTRFQQLPSASLISTSARRILLFHNIDKEIVNDSTGEYPIPSIHHNHSLSSSSLT